MHARIALLAACALTAGCAVGARDPAARAYAPADAAGQSPECFNTRFINGYSEVDHDTVRVRVGRDDYYDIDVTGVCRDLEWNTRLALVSRQSNLCVGSAFGDARIVTQEDECSVLSISHSPRRPAEEAAILPFAPPDAAR